MKADIHPESREVIFQDGVTGALFKALSCVEASQTIEVDGEEFPLIRMDVSSASHPFYTGSQRIMDTAGRVEKFGSKYGAKLSNLLKKKS